MVDTPQAGPPVVSSLSSATNIVSFPSPQLPSYGANPTPISISSSDAKDHADMDDKDFRYLDTKIAASEERSQLRLETAMVKIEASISRLADQYGDISNEIGKSRSATTVWGQWIVATIVVLALTAFGLQIGLRQVWIGDVQVGQTLQTAAPSIPAKAP